MMTKGSFQDVRECNPAGQETRLADEALYAETLKGLTEGSVVEGIVLAIRKEGAVVDVGYKSEGLIPRAEFTPQEMETLEPGQKISVYLEELEDDDRNISLSKEKADRMRIWSDIELTYKSDSIVEGTILSRIRGGMIVDIGVKAFLPGSQMDFPPTRDPDYFIGKSYPMKIIKMDRRRGNIVVSRRVLMEESRDKKRKATLSGITEGQRVNGVVKNITGYGVFVDLGGIDGLLHITDMSWGRVGHPSEMFTVDDRVEVIVLKHERETGRVSLGIKQKTPDPWVDVETQYAAGTKVQGKVVNMVSYGAFVELGEGVEGLVHVSEMSKGRSEDPSLKAVAVGDMVDVVVLNVDRKRRKISLGMKPAEGNPWGDIEKRYPIGSTVSGKVRSITDFGLFVNIGDGIDGLVHVSDISWTRHVKNLSDVFKRGQTVEAVVLKIDAERERVSLGLKQLAPDPWSTYIPTKYAPGSLVEGKVAQITDFGVFVELEEGVEGLVHVSESGLAPGLSLKDRFRIGHVIEVKVLRLDASERKIALSVREVSQDADKTAIADYQSTQEVPDRSLGTLTGGMAGSGPDSAL